MALSAMEGVVKGAQVGGADEASGPAVIIPGRGGGQPRQDSGDVLQGRANAHGVQLPCLAED